MLDRRTPDDLAAWSRAWVEEAGRPIITTELKTDGRTVTSLALRQKDPYAARGLVWPQPLRLAAGHARGTVAEDLRLDGERAVPTIAPPGSAIPLYVLPNANGVSYGNFVLDPSSRASLLAGLADSRLEPAPAANADIGAEVARGSALVILWEEMVDGRIGPETMFDSLLAALPAERNELTLQRMLGYTQQAYWRWIPTEYRVNRASHLERVLRAGVDGARTSSLKSAWFNALRDVSVTPETLSWLESVWSKRSTVPGLVLAEPDFITLAQELALRGGPNSATILEKQIARTENPDRRARMVFVRPSLSRAVEERDAFFAQLKDPVNRRREAWVLEGLGYLHHPLRAAAAERHVRPSLEMLHEIQRTGDIFFPKRWLDATLSGHRSRAVANEVTTFLAALPDGYPDRLRRVILSAADDLFRLTRQARP